jgi:hypothetical protein
MREASGNDSRSMTTVGLERVVQLAVHDRVPRNMGTNLQVRSEPKAQGCTRKITGGVLTAYMTSLNKLDPWLMALQGDSKDAM